VLPKHTFNPTLIFEVRLTYLDYFFKNVASSGSTPKWQFNGNNLTNDGNAGFMLNTDFELFYDLTLDSDAKATWYQCDKT
jgi:hypothetical protein